MIIIIIINNNMKKNNDLDKTELKIKNSGYRLTKSRKTILDVLKKNKSELTAEEIFLKVLKRDSKIGLATIYRTIILLEKFKLISRSYIEGGKAKYKYSDSLNDRTAGTLRPPINNKTQIKEIYRSSAIQSSLTNYQEVGRINKIQSRLNIWIDELNSIKKEKEIELEEIINDFGRIDKILERHNYDKSNLIQILIDFQSEFNWLPKHILFYTGNKLNLPLSYIYNVASFYKSFDLEPRGKYQILVCEGTACHVRGSINLLQRIINVLKINPGETTADYKFTLSTVNCLGCCALGPVMLFNNKYHSNPSVKEIDKLFASVS